MAYAPITEATPITVSLGVQSVEMSWAKIEQSFRDYPSGLARVREELERDGVARHEDFGFFHPEHKG